MEHGSREYQLDDALRRVSNELHLRLDAMVVERRNAQRKIGVLLEAEGRLKADIAALAAVRDEITKSKMVPEKRCAVSIKHAAHVWAVDGVAVWCPGS